VETVELERALLEGRIRGLEEARIVIGEHWSAMETKDVPMAVYGELTAAYENLNDEITELIGRIKMRRYQWESQHKPLKSERN